MKVTRQAREDLAGIWAYVAEDAPEKASALIRQIEKRFEPLLHHPDIGARREELAPGLRVQFHKPYAIYYQVTESELIIVHVLHGAQDRTAFFRGDEE